MQMKAIFSPQKCMQISNKNSKLLGSSGSRHRSDSNSNVLNRRSRNKSNYATAGSAGNMNNYED